MFRSFIFIATLSLARKVTATDESSTDMPTAVIIGAAHRITTSIALSASPAFVMNTIIRWKTSITTPLAQASAHEGFLSSNMYFLSNAA